MTDELIELAADDLELQSVMLHEIGHVVHRHSLRRLIENSGATLLLIWLTGDIEAGSSWATILPTILLQSSYSRDIEREADGYALDRMLVTGISPQHFASMMKKLDSLKSHGDAGEEKDNLEPGSEEGEDSPKPTQGKGNNGRHWLDYISSHPPTTSRIRRFEDAAALHQSGEAQ
jgi:Zn-dependent protease with chaperone function